MDKKLDTELARSIDRLHTTVEGIPEVTGGKALVTDVVPVMIGGVKAQLQVQLVFDKKAFLKADEVLLVEKEKKNG